MAQSGGRPGNKLMPVQRTAAYGQPDKYLEGDRHGRVLMKRVEPGGCRGLPRAVANAVIPALWGTGGNEFKVSLVSTGRHYPKRLGEYGGTKEVAQQSGGSSNGYSYKMTRVQLPAPTKHLQFQFRESTWSPLLTSNGSCTPVAHKHMQAHTCKHKNKT